MRPQRAAGGAFGLAALVAAGQEPPPGMQPEHARILTLCADRRGDVRHPGVVVAAGHGTTVGLIADAVPALLARPDRPAFVRSGEVLWSAVVEESLRWTPQTSDFLFRFTTEDIGVGGAVIPAGAVVLVPCDAIGRDPPQHGVTAELSDTARGASRRGLRRWRRRCCRRCSGGSRGCRRRSPRPV